MKKLFQNAGSSNTPSLNARSCIVVIIFLAIVACSYFAFVSSDIFSPRDTSTIVPSPSANSPRVERTSTPNPTSISEINQLCPTWKTVRKDLSGTRYDIWLQFISTQPDAMEWLDFKEKSVVCNPVLVKDGFVFVKGKEYLLP
jgi:hypothetical protein